MFQMTKWLFIILLAGFWQKALAVDFDESTGLKRLGREFICDHSRDEKRYTLYEEVFKKNSSVVGSDQKIPQIIHQIWLSSKPIPHKYKKCQQSWQSNHPHWKYNLWTLDTLPPDLKVQVERAESNQEKEDLVRLYVLDKFGGMCADMASTSLVSLDSFHKNFHFYACLEPPLPKAQFDRRLHVATSFVGAIPHHPIIRAWAKKIKNLARSDKHVEASIASAAKNLKTRGWLTYLLFGSSVDQKLKSEEFINIVFPPTYAFPLSPTALRHSEKKKQSKTFFLAQILNKLGLKRAPPFSEIQPETVAIDTKGGTWADQKQIAIVVSK